MSIFQSVGRYYVHSDMPVDHHCDAMMGGRLSDVGKFRYVRDDPVYWGIFLGPTGQRYNVEFYVIILLLVFVCKRMFESVGLSVNSKTSPRMS